MTDKSAAAEIFAGAEKQDEVGGDECACQKDNREWRITFTEKPIAKGDDEYCGDDPGS